MASVILDWLEANFVDLIISAVTIVAGIILLWILRFELKRLEKNKRIRPRISKIIHRISQVFVFLLIITVLLVQYAQSVGILTAILTLMGGTVIGFAAMNTIGNFIAGIIIMTSKPFTIGDRIEFDDQLADVEDIEFIYTKLKPLDGTRIAIPNQELLKKNIVNLGKGDTTIMRNISITLDYSLDRREVEQTLIDAIKGAKFLTPKSDIFVTVNDYLNYAVEYKLYYYINDVKNILLINSELRKLIFDKCRQKGYDISVPLLLKDVK